MRMPELSHRSRLSAVRRLVVFVVVFTAVGAKGTKQEVIIAE